MPISQFTIGVSRTINLGNFESLRIEASVTMEVPEKMIDITIDNLEADAQAELKKLMIETHNRWSKKKEVAEA